VDEATRLSATDDRGDREATRISPAHLPPGTKVRLTTDDGAERIVDKAAVVGRNPAPVDGELLFVMKDDTRSVSKTHLRVDGTGEDLVVTDLGSTNGSTILREDGSRENLVPETPTVLPAGARVTLGDRTLSVERVQ
jgi:pSer/pThr/pTyr-binding forkhead associated (FHA) protein